MTASTRVRLLVLSIVIVLAALIGLGLLLTRFLPVGRRTVADDAATMQALLVTLTRSSVRTPFPGTPTPFSAATTPPTATVPATLPTVTSVDAVARASPALPVEATPAAATSPPTQGVDTPPVLTFEPTALPPEIIIAHAGSGPGSTPELDMAPGVYRVSFYSGAGGTVTPIVAEGACSTSPLFTRAGPSTGSATYRSTGCRVRFEVTDISGDWTLTVETATMGGLLAPPITVAGEGPGTTGLVELPQGEYLIVFKTSSSYSMVVPIVVSGQCLERPIFLLSEPGEYEETYASTGCQVIFQVSNITTGWELTISSSAAA